MKKDLIFTPAMLLVGVALFLLKATGIVAHIAISVVGLLVLVVYAVFTKKSWKLPALEIIMRVFYGIALITGVIIMNIHGIAVLSILHKASAAMFVVMLAVLFGFKLFKKSN